MSEELKNIYKGAGALDRYFEGKTPVDLFRGQKIGAPKRLYATHHYRLVLTWRSP